MKTADRNALIMFPVLLLIAGLFAWAGSQTGNLFLGIPVFTLSVALIFLIQWLAFIPAYFMQTEKFYDLTGGLTYIAVITLALSLDAAGDARSLLLWTLVVVWAARLGIFLFRRIQRTGKDDRFDQFKRSFIQFLNVWTVQALWITFTVSAAIIAITTSNRKELDAFAVVGFLVWLVGFGFEVVADNQKSKFSADPGNKGKFIQTGLWARSRHPNYFGEIVLWIGVMLIAAPVLQGWQWVALTSPVFVALLIMRISGVPMLENKADKKWGGQPEYEAYKKKTPVLIPRF